MGPGSEARGLPSVLAALLDPGREVEELGDGVISALAPEQRAADYDRSAAVYDRLVGTPLYNRIVWGSSPDEYAAFAAEAVADGDGPLLDLGCGSAIFSAEAYRHTERPLLLVDRSLEMLRRARERIPPAPGRTLVLMQADLFDLPLRPACFATVACHGLLHLFEDLPRALTVLADQRAAGGSIYATSLVADRALGRRTLQLLQRRGEAATPRTEEEVVAASRLALGGEIGARRQGSMAFLRAV